MGSGCCPSEHHAGAFYVDVRVWGRTVPADGKLTDIWVKALVLRDQAGHEAVWITADLIGIGAQSTREIAAALKDKHDCSASKLLSRRPIHIPVRH